MQKSTLRSTPSPDLINDLTQAKLETSADQFTRILYSTDASIYQIMPVGVVWPRDQDEVAAAVEIAGNNNTAVLPRGSGSSLAGQAIGNALILDFSRYMDKILEINPAERSVTVQPGAVLGPLNKELEKYQLTFGPDPASADRATIGGVLGNNATGAHSILYGMAHDHLIETETVLSDGSKVLFREINHKELSAKQKKEGREGAIYQSLPDIVERYRVAIQNNYPKTFRNVAGYNLNILTRQEQLNPAVLLAGSEGTLGIITSATLNLVPLVSHKVLYLIHFSDLKTALEAVPDILETDPSAIELIDQMLIELTRANPSYHKMLNAIQGEPAAVLAVEYQGEEGSSLKAKKTALSQFGQTVLLPRTDQQDQIWKARKVGLGLLQSKRIDAKPTAFIEDAAVPVEHLASYALGIKEYAREIGVGEIAFYAHASAGCLHIRPGINLKSQEGIKQMRLLAEKSLELILRFGGTTSGEHGEGIARGEFMEKLFGPEITTAFREVKRTFDPDNILNPGKIIDPPAMDSTELLRYGPDYHATYLPSNTFLSFELDRGFDQAVEMCNGAGVCRQLEGGVMCPSFQATRDETHSTRGRANALRAAMTGRLGSKGMTSSELHSALDLCLSCQACSSECPSSVDMSKLKAEFLYHYYQQHGLPFRSWFFAHIADVYKLFQPFYFLVNPFLKGPTGKLLSIVGIHPQRQLPAFSTQRFTSWYKKQSPAKENNQGGQAVFFYDTYLEYNYPHIGQAVTKIFNKAGLDLIVLKEKADSGRPAFSKGVLDKARSLAEHNINLLKPYAEQGIPIVGTEPSVVVMLTKEYLDLVPGREAEMVARVASLVEDYLLLQIKNGSISFQFDGQVRNILYHGHCQQKANLGTEQTLALLSLLPNSTIEEVTAGCCGMAGAFGYEKEHSDLSLEIAELELAPRIRDSDDETVICASGTSCREQILQTTNRAALHPLEVFADALV